VESPDGKMRNSKPRIGIQCGVKMVRKFSIALSKEKVELDFLTISSGARPSSKRKENHSGFSDFAKIGCNLQHLSVFEIQDLLNCDVGSLFLLLLGNPSRLSRIEGAGIFVKLIKKNEAHHHLTTKINGKCHGPHGFDFAKYKGIIWNYKFKHWTKWK